MKRLIFLLFASILVLSACGGNEKKEEPKKDTQSKEKKVDKDKGNKKEKDKEVAKQPKQQADEQPKSLEQTVELTQQQTQNNGYQQPEQQASQNYVPQQNTQVQQSEKQRVDLNSMPPTDFSTEGMSEQAQRQIEELTIQKDFHGLPQEEYNDRVSEIINNDNQ
ncbi:hypothetical protein GWK87_11065 [Staphylococcus schleiferi subsp. coagulans]|uniref:hypothetical protein n=1 Tax=Staphylococcus coagulans TaxID=74706 RepID=UPI0015F8EB90|nr:hypothetical protein [Staphylococcus coagulans]MBA8760771.1 hypothetical protein [Staphylococcus coagulans]MBA8769505.1 hypothetical protein [Staphylococcus coagulans]